jgi:hypothetical protein
LLSSDAGLGIFWAMSVAKTLNEKVSFQNWGQFTSTKTQKLHRVLVKLVNGRCPEVLRSHPRREEVYYDALCVTTILSSAI